MCREIPANKATAMMMSPTIQVISRASVMLSGYPIRYRTNEMRLAPKNSTTPMYAVTAMMKIKNSIILL